MLKAKSDIDLASLVERDAFDDQAAIDFQDVFEHGVKEQIHIPPVGLFGLRTARALRQHDQKWKDENLSTIRGSAVLVRCLSPSIRSVEGPKVTTELAGERGLLHKDRVIVGLLADASVQDGGQLTLADAYDMGVNPDLTLNDTILGNGEAATAYRLGITVLDSFYTLHATREATEWLTGSVIMPAQPFIDRRNEAMHRMQTAATTIFS